MSSNKNDRSENSLWERSHNSPTGSGISVLADVNLTAEDLRARLMDLCEQPRTMEEIERMFEWILLWIKHDPARSSWMPTHLRCIPLYKLSYEYFNSFAAKEIIIIDSSPMIKFMIEIFRQIFVKYRLYCFGGKKERYIQHKFNYQILSSVSLCHKDPHLNGNWRKIKGMSCVKYDLTGAVIGDKIYICGGTTKRSGCLVKIGMVLNTMHVLDCRTNTWKKLRNMPNARRECAAAALNGFIYVTGGVSGSYAFSYKQSILSSVIKYNVHTNKWMKVKSMKIKRQGHQLVELNGRLYAINGKDRKTIEEYDPIADEWRILEAENEKNQKVPMHTHYEHYLFGAAAHDGKIYVCSINGFEMYSPKSSTSEASWTTLPSPKEKYLGRTLVSINDKLWAIGGGPNFYGGTSSVFSYDPSENIWEKQPNMDVARKRHCSFLAVFTDDMDV